MLLIGSPGGRRVVALTAAARAAAAPLTALDWAALAAEPARLGELGDGPPLALRLEPIEDPALEPRLLELGYAAAERWGCERVDPQRARAEPAAPEALRAPRQRHLGWLALLAQLEAQLPPRCRPLTPFAALPRLFDKGAAGARHRALGVPTPEPLTLDEATPDDPLAALERALGQRRRAFVKLSCGSSASGLAVVSRAGEGLVAMTTIEQARDGRFNNRRLRRVSDPDSLRELLRWLLAEGAVVEAAAPKARLAGARFDCRVLCVAGEPAFTVARCARHPVTNLQLGGWRGELAELERAVPAAERAAAWQSCRSLAADYGCFQLGIDVMFERGGGHRVIEVNAFGDLLPRLYRDGLDVYGWQLRELARRWRPEATPPWEPAPARDVPVPGGDALATRG